MAPPILPALISRIFFTFTIGVATAIAGTFPLPAPTRPTTFPLQRPALAGEVIAWGKDDVGQTSVPLGLSNVVALSSFRDFTLALQSDGTVVAWGYNIVGQTNVPPGLSNVVAVSAGGAHSAALRADGTVVCWGDNWAGQTNVPSGLSGVVAVAAGDRQTLALHANGTITSWGYSDYAQSLRVNYSDNIFRPATNVISIAAGPDASFALLSDGRTAFWPSYFSLAGTNRIAVAKIEYATEVAAISYHYTPLILRRDGILSPAPQLPLNLKPVAVCEGYGSGFTMALNTDGSVTLWGDNPSVMTSTPPRLRGVFAIASGQNHAVVAKIPTPPIPTTATATAQIINGFLVALNIIDGGEGYAEPPKVTITGGGGAGATATAQITKGIVTGFTITNAGIGYTGQPDITIDPPPFLPTLGISPSRVNVNMQVVPGKQYLLESATELPNFSPVGQPFIAPSNTITNEFVITQTGQFFRIQEVP